VFVALADIVNQGIGPVSASFGNGDNPKTNLYWGVAFGIRTLFTRNKDWELISITPNPGGVAILNCSLSTTTVAPLQTFGGPKADMMIRVCGFGGSRL